MAQIALPLKVQFLAFYECLNDHCTILQLN